MKPIFDVCVYVYIWLQGHGVQAKVIKKCVGNIGKPFCIPYIDIRQRWLPTDTPIHTAYHGVV